MPRIFNSLDGASDTDGSCENPTCATLGEAEFQEVGLGCFKKGKSLKGQENELRDRMSRLAKRRRRGDQSYLRKTLYKYRALDRNALSILIDRQLYFASPSQLNDPLDCTIDVSAALKVALRTIPSEMIPEGRRPDVAAALDWLEQEGQSLNENAAGVLSVSATASNAVMWSHYADEHKGLCFGFSARKLFCPAGNAFYHEGVYPLWIDYRNDNPVEFTALAWATTFNGTAGPSLSALVYSALEDARLAKRTAWSYEQEVRFLRGEGAGSVEFEPDALTHIIFGVKMPERDRKTVLSLLSDPQWQHVKVREMWKDRESLSFRVKVLKIKS